MIVVDSKVEEPKQETPKKETSKEDGETLIVTLKDVKEEIYLDLYYVIFRNLNVLVRFAKLINKTGKDIKINRISSFELNTPNDDYEIISIHYLSICIKILCPFW